MVMPDGRAHLAGSEVEDLAAGIVPHHGPLRRDEKVRERITAVADQVFLCGVAECGVHRADLLLRWLDCRLSLSVSGLAPAGTLTSRLTWSSSTSSAPSRCCCTQRPASAGSRRATACRI